MSSSPGRAWTASLLHPISLAALAILIANDHVLKVRYPGFVTGKLSDFAGMIFFPLALFAAIEELSRGSRYRPGDRALLACTIATGIVFTLVKVDPSANATCASAMHVLKIPLRVVANVLFGTAKVGGMPIIVMDATDLFALPALVLPFLIARRGGARREGEATATYA